MTDDLFKDNLIRLRAELEDAAYAVANSQCKHNRDLVGSIENARVKSDLLVREMEIREGEALMEKVKGIIYLTTL